MDCGFQVDAFQNNAFQVCVPVASVGADSFGGGMLDERMWAREPVKEEEPVDDLTIILAAYRECYI